MIPGGSLLLAVVLPLALATDDPARLLEKAFAAAAGGRYDAADRLYRRILSEAPASTEAATARQRLEPNALLRVRDLEVNGDPERRIDVFVMAEGYSRERKFQQIFDRAAEETLKYFDQAPVFRRYRRYFNFHAMNIASAEDGVDREGRDFDTALGAFQTDATQGQVAVDPGQVARYLALDPRAEGFAVVIVRLGTLGTGGGGVAVVGGAPSNVVIHEWGHAFAALGDEYTADVGYTGPTPRSYNVADSPDPARVPWKHWLEAGTNGVGVFPGAAGRSKGAWRGTATGCAMARGPSFCVICREAIVAHIYDLVSPLDEASPAGDRVVLLEPGQAQTFRVVPLEVSGEPRLEVSFVLTERGSPEVPREERNQGGEYTPPPVSDWWDEPHAAGGVGESLGGYYRWNRPSRQGKAPEEPLVGRSLRAARTRLEDGRTAYLVKLSAGDLEPGSYCLQARVTDPIGWVIREDWVPLLSETVSWRIEVGQEKR